MNDNRWEWIVTALEVIEKGKVLPRVLYGAAAAAVLSGVASVLHGLAALLK
jgi:hypothetical protein